MQIIIIRCVLARNYRSILELSLGCQLAKHVTVNRYKQLNSLPALKDIYSRLRLLLVNYSRHNQDF